MNGEIGYTNTSSNNSVLVTGAGSLWSNSGALTVGDAGNGTLTVANGGTVAASNIVIAAQANSSGTLNIGRFGGTDTAGTILSPTISFGSGTGTINFNQVNSTSITSAISGAGFVNQLGSGTTILSGSNSYTGPTAVKAGALEFSGTQSFYGGNTNQWTAVNLTVSSNAIAIFTVGGSNSFTSGDLNQIVTNATATTGFLSGSFLGLDTTGTNFTYAGNLANPNGGSNSLGLAVLGSGTLDLTGSNSYSGGTIIQSGTLQLGSTNALGSGTVNLEGGTLDLASQNNVTNLLTLTKGVLTNGSYNVADVTALSGTIASALIGSSSLTINTTGKVLLTGSNSYTGPTVIQAGTVEFGGTQALYGGNTNLWTTSSLTVSSNATAFFAVGSTNPFTAGNLDQLISNSTATTGFLSGSSLGIDTTGTNFIYASNLTNPNGGSNALGLTVLGSGTLDLTGTNSYTGGTLISAATQIGNISLSAGTLEGDTTSLQGTITNNGSLIFVQSTNGIFAGVISGSGSLTKNGSATLTLVGSNSYSGGTILNAGTLAISNNAAFGTGAVTFASNSTVTALTNLTIANAYHINSGVTGTFDVLPGATLTNSGVISGSGTLSVIDGGTLILTGQNTYSGGTIISTNTTLQVGNGSTSGTLGTGAVINSNSLTFGYSGSGSQLISNNISGSGSVTQFGTGTTILSGSNSYGGGTFINAGTLAISNNNAFGTGSVTFAGNGTVTALTTVTVTNTYVVNSGVTNTFDIVSGASLTNSGVITGGGSVSKLGTGTLTITGSNSYTGGTLLSAGTLVVTNSGTLGSTNGSVTITGGILELGNNLSIGTFILNGGLLQGGGTLYASSYNVGSGTISANLGGTGSLTTIGNGTITLTGSNTYSGGSTLNGGTVDIGSSNALGTGTVTFASNSTIAALTNLILTNAEVLGNGATGTLNNGGNSLTNAGTISGAGTLSLTGSGTTTLTGSNSYSGGTTLNGGTVAINNNNALGTGTVTFASNSTIAALTNLILTNAEVLGNGTTGTLNNGGNSLTNGGTISGAGTLSLTGSGTTTLTGNNSYTGGTTLNGGTAAINNNNALGTGTVTFASNSTITALSNLALTNAEVLGNGVIGTLNNGGNSLTNGGTISGAGALTLTGSGITTLTASNSYTGGTTINSGTVITSNPGALGSGTLNLNGGNLSLNSQLNVSALIWTNSASQIAIPNFSANTFLNVSGNITLGSSKDFFNLTGANLSTTPEELLYFGTNQLTIGDFGILGVSNYTLIIIGDALFIESLGSFTNAAQTPNQVQVATALDSFIPATSGDKQVVVSALASLPASQLPAAFNAIMPNIYLSLSTIAFNSANAQNNELVQRLWGLRVAGTGFSMSGMPDNTPVIQQPAESDGKDFKNPVSAKDYKQPVSPKSDILRPGEDNHWGMFLDSYGIFAQANSANMLPTYNAESGGVVTGLTYKWNENFGTGLYAGYQGTYAKYNGGSSLVDNAVLFGLFGTYGQPDGKGFYADALVGGGYNNYQVSRNINLGLLNRTANSSPGASELTSLLAAGYNIKRGNWTFGPLASLQYTDFGANAVSETGAQSLDYNSSSWNTSSLLSYLGGQLGYTWQVNRAIVVVPQLNLGWQHEFLQNPYAMNGTLGGSPTFTTWAATPTRDTLYTGVGFTVEFYKKWNTSLFYNSSVGNQNLVSQNVFWGLGVKF